MYIQDIGAYKVSEKAKKERENANQFNFLFLITIVFIIFRVLGYV